jgi:outer membrane protein OmpA-like peptidoglycan-associated protein
LVGALGVLAYSLFSMWPSVSIRHEDFSVAVEESTRDRHPAAEKPPARKKAPRQSESSIAKKTQPPADPKDPGPVASPPAPSAIPEKGKMDRPAAASLKQGSWNEKPVAESGQKPADEDSTKAGSQSAAEDRAPEMVSASQGAAAKMQRFYVLFKPGSAELENRSFDVLMQVSQLLAAYPDARITLASFFDPAAKPGYAGKLLALRANCVKSFLASRGIGARLTVVSGSAESLPGTNRPPATGDVGSWSEIRFETGKEG